MTTAFDTIAPPRPASRLRAIPRRALLVAGTAALAIAVGAWWIASPASSVSTDDAYLKADSTLVAPKVQGLIGTVLVRDNQSVKAGQPLLTINAEDYRQALAAAEADVQSAQATLAQQPAQEALADANAQAAGAAIRSADAERLRATADRARFDTLVSTGDISKSQADQARAAATSAEADSEKSRATYLASRQQVDVVAKTRAQLLAALAKSQAALLMARQNLDRTIVRAPVSGVIGDRQAQIGEYVQPGTQLMTIVPMRTLYVTANFKETQTARMLVGQRVHFTIDAVPGQTFEGEVESFAPGSGSEFSLLPFEPATGNFTRIVQRVPVRIRVLPGQKSIDRLRPGLSAQVTVDLRN
ncbi:MAG TPA: HlyD family secretion protein [Rhizomicrobium sp.]|jgi:membrane fusion protein (multidrug efflux system)